MQIEVRQSTQMVASNRRRRLQDEELDWILTKMQDRFVRKQLRPLPNGAWDFEPDSIGAEALRPIISMRTLTPYIEIAGYSYKCFLPPDYEYLISDASSVTDLCGTQPAVTTGPLYLTVIKQVYSGKSEPLYYETWNLQFGTSLNLTLPDDLALGKTYTGYSSKEDVSFLRRYAQLKGDLYWESFGDAYSQQDCYILVTPAAVSGTKQLVQDGTPSTEGDTTTLTLSYHPGSGIRTNNRLTKSSEIDTLSSDPFRKTSAKTPVSELRGGNLYVYRSNSFTLNSVEIRYIRKLLPISVVLGTGSELPESYHQVICDLASEYIKGRLENAPGEQLIERDNQLRNSNI